MAQAQRGKPRKQREVVGVKTVQYGALPTGIALDLKYNKGRVTQAVGRGVSVGVEKAANLARGVKDFAIQTKNTFMKGYSPDPVTTSSKSTTLQLPEGKKPLLLQADTRPKLLTGGAQRLEAGNKVITLEDKSFKQSQAKVSGSPQSSVEIKQPKSSRYFNIGKGGGTATGQMPKQAGTWVEIPKRKMASPVVGMNPMKASANMKVIDQASDKYFSNRTKAALDVEKAYKQGRTAGSVLNKAEARQKRILNKVSKITGIKPEAIEANLKKTGDVLGRVKNSKTVKVAAKTVKVVSKIAGSRVAGYAAAFGPSIKAAKQGKGPGWR